MRRAWIVVPVLAAAGLLGGCGDGGSDKVSAEETKSVLEAIKKVEPHNELKTGKPASPKK